ncbi:uncharacterized protein [Acropora muricata]|uniref:uncharacterized protein isoform X2 n=1 Tax=Acropora muricata TaxID=159855 RepID=UPI0034E43730
MDQGNPNTRDVQRDLLQRTTNVLRTVLSELESPVSAPSPSSASPEPSSPANASDDFRRAFPGLCSRNVVRPSLCRPTTPLATSTPKRKKTMFGYVPLRFQPLETWTHEVCVLARCDEDATPTRERLEELISAGLGKAKLVFPDKKADHNKVQLFLEEKFPKLKSAGGFEVLRASGGGGGQRPLSLLPPSKEGYSVPHLKERLGQAVAYIRPLQVDLDVTPNTVLEDDESPTVSCLNCKQPIPMLSMRDHQLVCVGGSSSMEPVQSRELTVNIDPNECDVELSSQRPKEEPEKILQAMFKDIPKKEIAATFASVGDVNRAAELLLLKKSSSVDSDDDLDYCAWDERMDKPSCCTQEARLFEGQSNRRLPLYNGDAVLGNMFVLAGKMVSYLISHYDVGIPCLTQAAYMYICTSDIEVASQKCTAEDIPDPDLQDVILKVNKAKTANELHEAITESFMDAMVAAGWINQLTVENKDVALWQIVVHESLLKRKAPLDQFIDGLKVLKLHQLLQMHPEQMRPYFTHAESTLNKEAIMSLFDNLDSEHHDDATERCLGFFIQAIADLEKDMGAKGLKKFLTFLTGLEEVPPLGFSKKIEVRYLKDRTQTLYAETCTMVLKLPTVHTEYSLFKAQFMLACNEGSLGFACA